MAPSYSAFHHFYPKYHPTDFFDPLFLFGLCLFHCTASPTQLFDRLRISVGNLAWASGILKIFQGKSPFSIDNLDPEEPQRDESNRELSPHGKRLQREQQRNDGIRSGVEELKEITPLFGSVDYKMRKNEIIEQAAVFAQDLTDCNKQLEQLLHTLSTNEQWLFLRTE
ncbi:MAG: hypothetical protein M1831_003119 [Alyxoria varia]|nr:MAG: hypothetical protein M1831_003119 [Alyxoria varia]